MDAICSPMSHECYLQSHFVRIARKQVARPCLELKLLCPDSETLVNDVAFIQGFLFTNWRTSDCLKNSIKIYIKIAPTCFGAVTPSSGDALLVLAEVTVVKIANYGSSMCDSIGGDVAACSLLVCVCRTVRKYTDSKLLKIVWLHRNMSELF
jgi:hypothetical protein